MSEHPENILPAPSSSGFFFCLYDACDQDIDLYHRVRAGEISCPAQDTCKVRADTLELVESRKVSRLWGSLKKWQQKRIPSSGQRIIFMKERVHGTDIVMELVTGWIDKNPGSLLSIRAKRLFADLPDMTETGQFILL